ncbi:MAG: tRNA (adenosine(37)-N6)-threonylcarbamoyltransferase complex ATPase subunit type 1 TsaE [Gemmatimonadota bacterium]
MADGRARAGAVRRVSATLSESELVRWSVAAGRIVAVRGGFVCLFGELGAGKSTVVRAACRGAGVEVFVRSPTFSLLHEYPREGRGRVLHADLYRLDGPGDLADLGWDELVGGSDPVFVEWADRAAGRLPPDRWEIRLRFVDEPGLRGLEARAVGDSALLPALQGADAAGASC